MVPASGASYNKAFFTNVDTGSTFYVQFNPKEFKLDEKANWKASDEHQADKPLLTYEKGEPSVVTMDLIFDSTDDGSNVYDSYVEPLRDFLTADVDITDNEGDQMSRPPYCKFTWGSFVFECVVEKVSCTFLMFKPDGTPLRAKVQVGLKERERNVSGGGGGGVTLTALGSMFSGASGAASTYTTQPGDTLSSIASRTGAKASDIGLANDVSDPMNIPPGQEYVIPADPTLAAILANQSRSQQPGNWSTGAGGGDSGLRARGGDSMGPSAFEEDGPVGLSYDVDPGSIANPYASFGAGDYAARTDSDGTLGTSGTGAELGGYGDSGTAESFRNDATPDAEGAGPTAQGYGGYGDSEGTLGTSGQGAAYGGYGDSEGTLGTSGEGAALGGYGDSGGAGAFRDTATPDAEGAGPTAQGYGGYGESEGTFGTTGDGAALGGYGDSGAAGSFRDTASPDAAGSGPTAQGYGGYGQSDGTFGTSGTGAGGYGSAGGGGGGGEGGAGGAGPAGGATGGTMGFSEARAGGGAAGAGPDGSGPGGAGGPGGSMSASTAGVQGDAATRAPFGAGGQPGGRAEGGPPGADGPPTMDFAEAVRRGKENAEKGDE